MIDRNDVPAEGEQPEQEPEHVPNRRERRGHAQKNAGVNKIPGRPQQANFVGRRLFRRNGG
ncbi:hypothetical protein GCM10010492_48900 [Saccharothrix mutabilis subsp. mutabilis]|uniref:Uncharacterized protein n=1 Tax=Saccharothrix mutabilis subsp. mutabilis TaxID=66855 RepID=A0ABN0UA72_9PSEU